MRQKSDLCEHTGNRGFSLVELIVAMAIMTIVGGCVIGLITTSSNSYNVVSAEADLQEEAQLVMNQLGSLLMNAQNGVSFDASSHTLSIYNSTNRYLIEYDSEGQQLLYFSQDRKKDDAGNYLNEFSDVPDDAEQSLMADYLESFQISIDESDDGMVVDVSMGFSKKDKTYETSRRISLRNTSLKQSDDLDELYASEEKVTPVTATYYGITVTLGEEKFSTGTTNSYVVSPQSDAEITIPISVTIKGNYFPSQSYTAELIGSSITDPDKASRISEDQNSVIIGAGESSAALYLTVTSTAASNLSCSVTINPIVIESVAIRTASTIKPEKSFKIGKSFTLGSDFSATVTAKGNVDESDTKVVWEAVQNCTIDGDTLTITSDTSAIGQSFIIRARAKASTSVYAEYSGTVLALNSTLKLYSADSSVYRGDSISIQAYADDGSDEIYTSSEVTFCIKSILNTTNNASADAEAAQAVSVDANGKLSVSTALDYNKSYQVVVEAALVYAPTVTKTITINIPAVTVKFSLAENGVRDATSITVYMKGVDSRTIYYEISGVKEGTIPTIKWVRNNVSFSFFESLVSINASSIVFTKSDLNFGGYICSYDDQLGWVVGTIYIDGNVITSSSINVTIG